MAKNFGTDINIITGTQFSRESMITVPAKQLHHALMECGVALGLQWLTDSDYGTVAPGRFCL